MKTDPHFRNFIEDLNLDHKPSDVSFYCIVRWLSTSNGLNRFVELLEAITRFVNEISKLCPQMEGGGRMQYLMCLTNIMSYLQTLNLALQGNDHFVSDLSTHF